MDDDDDLPSGDGAAGAGWLATFADLMSLLMCFFVLLLSFAEMDAAKFKRLAGSMRNAFGVQQEVQIISVPKGTSFIAQEFSPSTPEETAIREIWQKTSDDMRDSLEVQSQDTGSTNNGDTGNAETLVVVDKTQDLVGETEQDAMEIASALHRQIQENKLEVESEGRQIILRLKEQGTFDSGSADLKAEFKPVLAIIHQALAKTPGTFRVEGHTDDDPISSSKFRSNWALSSARAVTLAHALFGEGELSEKHFVVSGFADTRPLEPNDSPAGKARNRRVEVIIDQAGVGPRKTAQPEDDDAPGPEVVSELPRPTEWFELRPEELF